MFTLTLTLSDRAEVSNSQGVEGGLFRSLGEAIALGTEHPHYRWDERWHSSEEAMRFHLVPELAPLFLPFLTADMLKQYSPDLANKLRGLREWIDSLPTDDAGE